MIEKNREKLARHECRLLVSSKRGGEQQHIEPIVRHLTPIENATSGLKLELVRTEAESKKLC